MSNFLYDSRWNARCDPEPLTTREKIVWAIAAIVFIVAHYIVFAFATSQQNIDIHVHCTRQLAISGHQVSTELFNLTYAVLRIPKTTTDPIAQWMFCIMGGFVVVLAVAFYIYASVVSGLIECHLFILSCLVHVS